MNDFLIDTHVFLWLNFSPEKISKSVLEKLQDKKNSLSVSVITFWEIALKYRLGKLKLSGVFPHELLEAAKAMGIQISDLSPILFATFFQLPNRDGHKDPFDQLIIWQCINQNKILVSHDKKLNDDTPLGLRILSS